MEVATVSNKYKRIRKDIEKLMRVVRREVEEPELLVLYLNKLEELRELQDGNSTSK